MEINLYARKGIDVGDWVESICLKGYFKVYKIERCYRDGKDIGNILLLKKAFTPAMKFSFATEKCHTVWCEKAGENKVCEIQGLLQENLAKKKKFDELPPLFPCIRDLYFLDIEKEQIESYRQKLKALPRYFTKEQFDRFVVKFGMKNTMKTESPDPKNAVTLSICTEEWMVDSKKNMLFCDAQIGNAWGTLAKLDVEKWSDFRRE